MTNRVRPDRQSQLSGMAAVMNDRRFIGIEIDPQWASISRDRIAAAANHLFAGAA